MEIGDVMCLKKWSRTVGDAILHFSRMRKPTAAVVVYLGDVRDGADDFDLDAAMRRLGWVRTKAAHDKAVKDAARLAKRMGPGWEPEVWENLGWHYSVRKGVCSIHPSLFRGKLTSYTVYFNTAKQVCLSADTPEDALGFAVQEARGIERKIAADCVALLND
jgi:hypothetical protein